MFFGLLKDYKQVLKKQILTIDNDKFFLSLAF